MGGRKLQGVCLKMQHAGEGGSEVEVLQHPKQDARVVRPPVPKDKGLQESKSSLQTEPASELLEPFLLNWAANGRELLAADKHPSAAPVSNEGKSCSSHGGAGALPLLAHQGVAQRCR
ncbi:hypothetical protein KIL84_004101 [Mauremys mutica]|uniref:Uncharacterized protein n=1 Tax=Mauremys mutica TaxID=74926 RepID=A0A9D4B726_9SAUR|nr:hypothetical protein KIL84_004101 [Mauremys mutica]